MYTVYAQFVKSNDLSTTYTFTTSCWYKFSQNKITLNQCALSGKWRRDGYHIHTALRRSEATNIRVHHVASSHYAALEPVSTQHSMPRQTLKHTQRQMFPLLESYISRPANTFHVPTTRIFLHLLTDQTQNVFQRDTTLARRMRSITCRQGRTHFPCFVIYSLGRIWITFEWCHYRLYCNRNQLRRIYMVKSELQSKICLQHVDQYYKNI